MSDLIDLSCESFVEKLSSSSSVPGGGGACALVGAIGMALGSMTAQLTLGKKSYADVEDEIREIINDASKIESRLMELVDEDAKAFEPLSKAYSLPTDTEEQRAHKEEVMEDLLQKACQVPLNIMEVCCKAIELHARLAPMATRIAISDVGCGAACCKAALFAAKLNVLANTRRMVNKNAARRLEAKADDMILEFAPLANEAYETSSARI